jgi:hypothetical protein
VKNIFINCEAFDGINGDCTGAKFCPLKHTAVVRRDKDRQLNGHTNDWTERQMDGQTEEQTDRWLDRQMA